MEKWNQLLQAHYSIVAVENDAIVGFGDIDSTGYLDRLFFMLTIREKELLLLSAISWSRRFRATSQPMLPLLQNLFTVIMD